MSNLFDFVPVLSFRIFYLPEQLLGPPLVGGESDDLPDQVSHELVVLGELALAAGGLRLQRVLGGLVTLLQTHADLISGRHCSSLLQQRNFYCYKISQIRKFMCHEREQLRLDGVLPSEEVLHAPGQVGAQYGLKLLASCIRHGPAKSYI